MCFTHLSKWKIGYNYILISSYEHIRLLLQLNAAVLLCKVGDANGIRGVQLALQEGTAGIDYVWHLEHGCRRQQLAHRHLSHTDLAGVHEVQDAGHGRGTDLKKRNGRTVHLLNQPIKGRA